MTDVTPLRFGHSKSMRIGSLLIALAGSYTGVIWLAGYWTEKYRWQPDAVQMTWFWLGLGPACLILLISGLSMWVTGAVSWFGRRQGSKPRPLSFGGVFNYLAAAVPLGMLVYVALIAGAMGVAMGAEHDQRFLNFLYPLFVPTYTIGAAVTLVALLFGWIFTPRNEAKESTSD